MPVSNWTNASDYVWLMSHNCQIIEHFWKFLRNQWTGISAAWNTKKRQTGILFLRATSFIINKLLLICMATWNILDVAKPLSSLKTNIANIFLFNLFIHQSSTGWMHTSFNQKWLAWYSIVDWHEKQKKHTKKCSTYFF